jgi:hypothetical protein
LLAAIGTNVKSIALIFNLYINFNKIKLIFTEQDVQNVILLVKFITYYNSESFVTVTNHTPFKFFTILGTLPSPQKKLINPYFFIFLYPSPLLYLSYLFLLDTHIDDLRKAKLLSGNSKLTKKGREEVEKLIMETKVPETTSDSEMETKKGKEKST